MPKVLIIGSENETYKQIFSQNGLAYDFCANTEDEIFAKGQDAEAIVFSSTKFSDKMFSSLPKLKIISRTGIGIDTVDIPAASAHGVAVCNCANYGTADVAQHAIALLLSLIHSVPRYDRNIKAENSWSVSGIPNAVRLGEKSLGIVGFGRISQWICRVMRGFGMKIRVCDPYANKQAAEDLGVEITDLDTLLATSDILSLNAPLTSDTYHMINDQAFAKMKCGVYLVNTSRGSLVDEEALIRALETGRLSGAALDVYEKEPFDNENKLRSFENVVLTPHIAWRSDEAIRDLHIEVCENIVDFFNGNRPKNQLN